MGGGAQADGIVTHLCNCLQWKFLQPVHSYHLHSKLQYQCYLVGIMKHFAGEGAREGRQSLTQTTATVNTHAPTVDVQL